MSAIGISGSGFTKGPVRISAQAEYRPQDFTFARTQSLALRAAEWETRIRPMHSWSELAFYGAASGIGALALITLVTHTI